MHIGTGAKPPASTITVSRGQSTMHRPLMDAARRCWQRRHLETSHDLTTLTLIPFADIHRKLLTLNPHMFFVPIGDGRIGIGVESPSPGHIAAYERLTYYERKEIDAHREFAGPRVLLICASQNAVDPYTELMSVNPRRIIARSLRSIIKACVEGGAFTWQAAEATFGMPFEKASITVRHLDMAPRAWHVRTDGAISIGG